jgi:WD repeat-containing protein 35
MFIYLSKKIAIPNGVRLKSLSWNGVNGWIVCGGENGLLKVLKLEPSRAIDKKGTGGPSNLSMNQTLEGHNGAVSCVCWNENYRKLTTSDQYGLIIVWMLHKGMWFEEMINNRNKSTVRGMAWTADGQRICIVYQDGAVIVGSVDGNRLWGKELKMQLGHVEWSPDGRSIIFGTLNCEVHIYDSSGNYLSQLPLYCLDDTCAATSIIGIDWYDGAEGVQEAGQPTLAIGVESGRLQLMRHEHDESPVLIDTGLVATNLKWATNGSVLALAGSYGGAGGAGGGREVAMVQFYSPYGQHLRTLKVPGGGIQALSWEGGSLRVALAVESFIYFANIRPDYRWGFFGDTLVASYATPERTDSTVLFWNLSTDERTVKHFQRLLGIKATAENCVIAVGADAPSTQNALPSAPPSRMRAAATAVCECLFAATECHR